MSQHKSTIGTLSTLGYADPQALEHLATLMARPHTILVDIRFSPRSRWMPQWNKKHLQAVYGDLRYLHLQGLGNVNYNKPGHPIQLLDPDASVRACVELLQSGWSLILLCACKHYEQCHRKIVFDLIQAALLAWREETVTSREKGMSTDGDLFQISGTPRTLLRSDTTNRKGL